MGSTWAMMDQKTRRLSKMPGEVKAEILPWFNDKHALQEDLFKIIKLDDNAKYVTPDLKVRRCSYPSKKFQKVNRSSGT